MSKLIGIEKDPDYIDTGCKWAKKQGYCMPCIVNRTTYCPFLMCLEDLHDDDHKLNTRNERNNKILELHNQGYSIYRIAILLHIAEATARHVITGKPFAKKKELAKIT